MPDVLAAFGDLAHRLDADFQVQIRVLAKDLPGRLAGLDAVSPEREIRNQEERSDRNFAGEAPDEECRGFHFDCQRPFLVELRLELVVELPKPVIGSMDDSGS